MNTQLTHTLNDCVELRYEGQLLFRYTYRPDIAPAESPKPYFHPMHTLKGNPATIFRPNDHPWHVGLAMTFTDVSGQNFWGGPTFVDPDRGYVQLDNNGRQEHLVWHRLELQEDRPLLDEELAWITSANETWLSEQRKIRVSAIEPEAGYWVLHVGIHLTNVSGKALHIGSPTTSGRPAAGYGSLFWRGPRSFTGGKIFAEDGLEGEEIMGKTSPWLAFIGTHDQTLEKSTLLFIDDPSNPRYPTQWFVRSTAYGCVSFSFMFDELYDLANNETLNLNYRIVIADGEWTTDRISQTLSALQ